MGNRLRRGMGMAFVRSWIDLHLHSEVSSDGEIPPALLMELCALSGLEMVSLTDHNSLGGTEEAASASRRFGLDFIPGIELDCLFGGHNLHVLGYGIRRRHSRFREIEMDIQAQERVASGLRVDLVRQLGLSVPDQILQEGAFSGSVTGEMIAKVALMERRNLSASILEPYRPGGPRADNPLVNFYWDYCSPGKAAHVPIRFISLAEAVALIQEAEGMAVLAHPGQNLGQDAETAQRIVQEGVQGIEVFSSYHSTDQVDLFSALAVRLDAVQTMGSDFHGKTKPAVILGPRAPEEAIFELYARMKRYRS